MITYGKRKRSKAPAVIIAVIALTVIVAGGYFGYNRFIEGSYPIKYQSFVERYSAENHLNKYFVYAVIKTESGFDPSAESNVGARGLMQIMQDTSDWIKFKSDDESAVYYDMYNAEINIKYGCRLLGYLTEEFGNIEAAAAAYHAGRGNGVHLDEIPISDTAHYVRKIKKAMDKYVKLYDKN